MSGISTVTAGPPPAPIAGPLTMCIGAFDTLTDATAGGFWNCSSCSVATINGVGEIMAVALGTEVITYTSPLGCSATAVVTVNTGACTGTPIAGTTSASATSICGGNFVLL